MYSDTTMINVAHYSSSTCFRYLNGAFRCPQQRRAHGERSSFPSTMWPGPIEAMQPRAP